MVDGCNSGRSRNRRGFRPVVIGIVGSSSMVEDMDVIADVIISEVTLRKWRLFSTVVVDEEGEEESSRLGDYDSRSDRGEIVDKNVRGGGGLRTSFNGYDWGYQINFNKNTRTSTDTGD